MRQLIRQSKMDHSITFAIILFIIIIFSAFQLSAQEIIEKEKNKKTEFDHKADPNSPQALNDKIEFKNNSTNSILTITDEGNDAGSITLPDVGATRTGNKLYNNGGSLYWNSSTLSSGGATELNDLTDVKTDSVSFFIGLDAGANDDGGNSDGHANWNTAIGGKALYSNTTGRRNTSQGYSALYSNTSGYSNTANGHHALYYNNGIFNTAVGDNALHGNKLGSYNTASGSASMSLNNDGSNNTAYGFWAMYGNTSGENNVGVGLDANALNQWGSNNTIIGTQAGRGSFYHGKNGNVFIGYKAGFFEHGDNKLYIQNDSSTSPLIYGDFTNGSEIVLINGDFEVTGKSKPSTFQLTTGAASGHVLTSDASGNASWQASSASDNDWTISGNDLITTQTGNVGIGTSTLTTKLNVEGNEGVLFKATHGNGTLLNLGAGTRFHFYPEKSAVRSGYVNGTQWDNSNIGAYSTAFGNGTIASGGSSVALGFETEASGGSSFAAGYQNIASGFRAAAFNSETTASGSYSNSFGVGTKAEAFYSTAIGAFNIGGGDPSNIVSTDPVFEVGIGSSDAVRENAFTVLKNGKVGVGTTSPTEELEVDGSVKVTGTTQLGAQGVAFSEIKLLTDPISTSSHITQIPYPTGYDQDNTYILSCKVGPPTGTGTIWENIGKYHPASDDRSMYVSLSNTDIILFYPSTNTSIKDYKILVMKID